MGPASPASPASVAGASRAACALDAGVNKTQWSLDGPPTGRSYLPPQPRRPSWNVARQRMPCSPRSYRRNRDGARAWVEYESLRTNHRPQRESCGCSWTYQHSRWKP